jgi:AraC-like DNA-binding protein
MRVAPINLKILAYTLHVEGFDPAGVLRRCGLPPMDALPEDGEWVPLALFDQLMAAVVEETGDTAFGLLAGKSLALMRYAPITPVAIYSPSLRQLLADVWRFAPLVIERCEIELVEAQGSAHLLLQPVVRQGLSGHFRAESVLTSAMQMLRLAGADGADIHQIEVAYALPAGHERRYEAAFGPGLRFGCKETTIRFNPALLDRPMPSHDPVSYTAACTRAESLLAAQQAGSSVAEQVRLRLLRGLPALPTVAHTAAQMGLSERTLRRQLQQLGASHDELLRQCQQLQAERLLAEGRWPIKHVAEQVGFGSVQSFHRAFRRWSGHTPADWRGGQGAQGCQEDKAG